MSDIFDDIISREGGYSNDPTDPGSETKYGISKRAYPHLDIKNLTLDQARAIYVRDYYLRPHIDRLPEHLQASVLDWYVNSGNVAIKALQRLTNSVIDGIIGSETIHNSQQLSLNLYNIERTFFYARLVQNNPSLSKYLLGWLRRSLSFIKDN